MGLRSSVIDSTTRRALEGHMSFELLPERSKATGMMRALANVDADEDLDGFMLIEISYAYS